MISQWSRSGSHIYCVCFFVHEEVLLTLQDALTLRLLKTLLFTPFLVMHWSSSSRAHHAVQTSAVPFGLAAMFVLSQFWEKFMCNNPTSPAVNQWTVHNHWNCKIIWTGYSLTDCQNRQINRICLITKHFLRIHTEWPAKQTRLWDVMRCSSVCSVEYFETALWAVVVLDHHILPSLLLTPLHMLQCNRKTTKIHVKPQKWSFSTIYFSWKGFIKVVFFIPPVLLSFPSPQICAFWLDCSKMSLWESERLNDEVTPFPHWKMPFHALFKLSKCKR